MDINVKLFSNEELNTFRAETNSEIARRAKVHKLLYELNGALTGYEYLSFTHNQLGNELFNTKNVEEPEDAPGWFAPELHIERIVK